MAKLSRRVVALLCASLLTSGAFMATQAVTERPAQAEPLPQGEPPHDELPPQLIWVSDSAFTPVVVTVKVGQRV